MTKSIYIAGGWFDEQQENALRTIINTLQHNKSVNTLFIPMEHQAEAEEFSQPWQDLTFRSDIAGIQNSDILLATLTDNPDTGTIWEMGYAYGINKPVLAYNTKTSLNLMPAKGTLYFIDNINDLEHFDFNNLPSNLWMGNVQ